MPEASEHKQPRTAASLRAARVERDRVILERIDAALAQNDSTLGTP